MDPALKILMLLTDGFGGFGGISRFNMDFLTAMDASPAVARVQVLPRMISDPIEQPLPEAIVYDYKAAQGKIAFMWRSFVHARRDKFTDLVICGHLNLLPAAWMVSKLTRARLALIIHGAEAWRHPANKLTAVLASRVDAFIAVSLYSANRYLSWSKVSENRGFILPNCVDINHFCPQSKDPQLAKRYGINENKVILTLGRLVSKERYKGFDNVIEIMPHLIQRFPDLKYLIVGDGPDRSRLEQKSKSLGVSDKVVFAGRIAESEKVAHYGLADAYVMPSLGEGFGIVLIEAAACGVPIIGSGADGSREALLDGRIGEIIDPRNPHQLIESVSRALLMKGPHHRNNAVEVFSVRNFQARVDTWLNAQVKVRFPMIGIDGETEQNRLQTGAASVNSSNLGVDL